MAAPTAVSTGLADRRRVPMPMVYRYLGDKRFSYTLPRAISLQILHPGNAASLVQHVHGGLWAHKSRAVGQMIYIAYSNRDLRSVMRTAHSHVKGVDSRGTRYHSLNPDLFFFQHATYVDTLFHSIEIFHGRLDADESEQLYQQCRRWYAKYDISDRAEPATYPAFVEYFEHFCQTELAMSPDAQALRRETLSPPTWFPHRVPSSAIRAMLHPVAADLLDVRPSAADRTALRAYVAATNLRTAMTPAKYQCIPSARHAPDA